MMSDARALRSVALCGSRAAWTDSVKGGSTMCRADAMGMPLSNSSFGSAESIQGPATAGRNSRATIERPSGVAAATLPRRFHSEAPGVQSFQIAAVPFVS
jgi:hypothetical protein